MSRPCVGRAGRVSQPGPFPQTGSGSLSGITSKAGSDAAAPTSRELWFWSRSDFWNGRKSPARVCRREHFTGEGTETARTNHGLVLGRNDFSWHLPLSWVFHHGRIRWPPALHGRASSHNLDLGFPQKPGFLQATLCQRQRWNRALQAGQALPVFQFLNPV